MKRLMIGVVAVASMAVLSGCERESTPGATVATAANIDVSRSAAAVLSTPAGARLGVGSVFLGDRPPPNAKPDGAGWVLKDGIGYRIQGGVVTQLLVASRPLLQEAGLDTPTDVVTRFGKPDAVEEFYASLGWELHIYAAHKRIFRVDVQQKQVHAVTYVQ